MQSIASRSNPKIKLVRSLSQRKARQESGLFAVEGTFHIGAALEARAPLEFALVAPEALRGDFARGLAGRLETAGVEVYEVSGEILASLSEKDNPPGMLAVAKQQSTSLSSLRVPPSSLSLAVVSPQDPGNLGSLLRTLDAAGGHALLALDGGVDAWHPHAVRAGMGAHFWKPIVQAGFSEFTIWAQAQGVHVVGSSAHAELDYGAVAYPRPSVLLLGSEREGLSAAQLAACEQVISLPMRGKVTSLNLAVAAGILLYAMDAKGS
jgi:TrmH family RNA methyltransferase